MIPVAPYKLAQFRRDIVFQRFIISAGGQVPFVEALVPNEDSHLVAKLKRFR